MRIRVTVCTLLALAIGIAPGRAQMAPTHDMVLFAKNAMVPMRDGIHLATDIYRPSHGGTPVDPPFPVLLQRTPYGKTGRGLVHRRARCTLCLP